MACAHTVTVNGIVNKISCFGNFGWQSGVSVVNGGWDIISPSKQIKILYIQPHNIQTSATIYKYTSTQLQKTPGKILTTASMTRILIMFMVVEVIHTLRI